VTSGGPRGRACVLVVVHRLEAVGPEVAHVQARERATCKQRETYDLRQLVQGKVGPRAKQGGTRKVQETQGSAASQAQTMPCVYIKGTRESAAHPTLTATLMASSQPQWLLDMLSASTT
jgi:hypothetical protein